MGQIFLPVRLYYQEQASQEEVQIGSEELSFAEFYVHHLFFLSCIDTLEILVHENKREAGQMLVNRILRVAISNSTLALPSMQVKPQKLSQMPRTMRVEASFFLYVKQEQTLESRS